ncbi:HAD family hydrolase [Tamlana nanhaiensis]|uniref:HAD family hydrolase n=1 Tax=Neotamlana nanhaiensis TaxID=1382798 RepID=A0A0D7VXM1_9FLAO|nr:HAD family hydrolase [Tamlana nanhaiensis]KJD31539.1 HAD family hydrolase [Tamlana nanhaiensis]
MSKYKCIIFDCDDILVDSEIVSNQVLVDMANEHGANIDLEYAFNHFKGSFIEACVEKISAIATKPLIDNFIEVYRERSFTAFKQNMKPVKGIKQVLEHLELPFCVASSGPEDKIKLNLELTGLLPHFEDRIFSCYKIQKWKPNPAVFLWAAETMGFKPEECLVIEDSLSGVTAAINGGFDVFGYTERDYKNELQTKATKTFGDMSELLNLISGQ